MLASSLKGDAEMAQVERDVVADDDTGVENVTECWDVRGELLAARHGRVDADRLPIEHGDLGNPGTLPWIEASSLHVEEHERKRSQGLSKVEYVAPCPDRCDRQCTPHGEAKVITW